MDQLSELSGYDAALYGFITAATLIVFLSYFPGDAAVIPGLEKTEEDDEPKIQVELSKAQMEEQERIDAEREEALIASAIKRQERMKRK